MSGVRCPLTFPLNDFFSETTGPGVIWFKFGHKHYWVKGLQIFTNGEAPPPFGARRGPKRGIFWTNLKKSSSQEPAIQEPKYLACSIYRRRTFKFVQMKVLRIVKVMQGDFKASYSRIVNQYFSNLKKNLLLKN